MAEVQGSRAKEQRAEVQGARTELWRILKNWKRKVKVEKVEEVETVEMVERVEAWIMFFLLKL